MEHQFHCVRYCEGGLNTAKKENTRAIRRQKSNNSSWLLSQQVAVKHNSNNELDELASVASPNLHT